MVWYMMACALMFALLLVTVAATNLPTPHVVVIDVAAMTWLLVVGVLALSGWSA